MSVAHIGAFSMPNWGDKLYPGAVASLLEEIGVDARISHFCPVPGETSAGEPIATLHDVRDSKADVALVGGGDILRFNNRTVALDHLSVPTSHRHWRINRLRARQFARKRFLPGPGVWAPAAPWLAERPSVLISAGVHTVPDNPAARSAVTNYRAAWVRTQHGADHLTGAGIPAERVVLAPDMIFALPDLDRPDAVRERGLAVLSRRLGTDQPPLIFHAAQFHGWPLERVVAVLETVKDLPVATLSLGSYAGEDRLLAAAARRFDIPTLHDLSADDITAVFAAAGAVFSTSMHAAIVSASFGTPALVPGIGKTKHAFEVCPEPPTMREVEDGTLRSAVDEVLGTRVAHSPAANRAAVVDGFRRTLIAADLI
ncbi:polysaccharide pyruvyl transferase family protein [Planococcus sp. APC 4015]|nr:polysaccharide pyruvyl transferase family protein [Planococcus sp. APC 4015]